MLDRLRRALARTGPGAGRTTGRPPSANGASSLHLRWDLGARCRTVGVTLAVVEPPRVAALYFWALQVDLADAAGRAVAGAHLGLQWHPSHPGGTAVNWGGYRGGGELSGSTSPLPSATANPNTRDLPWRPGAPHRLVVAPVPPGEGSPAPAGHEAWRATVTDLDRGTTTVVRDLWMPEGDVVGALVWSEVFARCDDPPAEVVWSDPEAVTTQGRTVRPAAATTSYQSHAAGGCANTSSWSAPDGLHQRTATERTTAPGAVLRWP